MYPNFPYVLFHFHFFFCDFVTVNDYSLSFTDSLPPDEEAFALKACGKIYFKFNREFSNCPKQQKTRPTEKYIEERCLNKYLLL